MHACTGDTAYLDDARRTTTATMKRLCDSTTGMLPDEGIDDTGLFKGILIRYLLQMAKVDPHFDIPTQLIETNAKTLLEQGLDHKGRAGTDWSKPPEGPIQLSAMLSGAMLIEAYASLFSS